VERQNQSRGDRILQAFESLQHIDRRVMYALLAIVVAFPLIRNFRQPLVVTWPVQGAYDTIEKMPADKLAIIDILWDSGTIAESRPQTEALIRHLMIRNKKFAIVAFMPQGNKLAYDSAKAIGKELGKVYGKDWIDWGYRPGGAMIQFMMGLGRDIPGTVKSDIEGKPVTSYPIMQGVKSIKNGDVGLIAEVTPSGTLDYWIAFVYGPYRTPIIYCPTAVMAPEGYNPLDAGQIKGMLTGMKGAAEYESLLGRKDFATRATSSLSTSHLLIIVLIIIGNIGYISSRRRRREG